MKKILTLIAVGLAATVAAVAGLPTYKTLSDAGNAASPSSVYFPSDADSQVRVVDINYASDTNKASLTFSTGTTAYWETQTNASSTSVTNWIDSTNGLSGSASLILEHGGAPYPASVSTFGAVSSTNAYGVTNWTYYVVLGSGGWNVNTTVGDNIYLMLSTVSIPVGATTNAISGDAIFVGNYGRPVEVVLSPALVTNQLYTVSAHYDSASQP